MSFDKLRESGAVETQENPATDDWVGNLDSDMVDSKLDEFESSSDDSAEKTVSKRELHDQVSQLSGRFTMNSRATLQHRVESSDDPDKFAEEIESSAVGGFDGHKAHLTPAGKEYYVMHSEGSHASGRFVVEDYPGDSIADRKENMQVPPGNDCSVVDKVRTTKPLVTFESRVAPQPEWAEKSGYTAREGGKQVYIPLVNGRRPTEETTKSGKTILEKIHSIRAGQKEQT